MKLVCGLKDFNEALGVVGKAIGSNSTLPVLGNVLLRAEGSRLYFCGTNMELAIECFVGAEVKGEGAFTVPAKLLTSYAGLLRDEKVEMFTDDGGVLQLKSLSSQTKIKGIGAEEFPSMPVVEKEKVFKVGRKELEQAINQTVFSCAVSSARPVLLGVLFDLKGKTLKLTATDSFRLSEKTVVLGEDTGLELQVIVPARTLMELSKILAGGGGDEVEIAVASNQILFVFGDVRMVSKLIEGTFPPYEKIIPVSSKTKVVLNAEEFALITRRVGLFAKENNNNIKISVTNDGKLNISTDQTAVGEERAEMDAVVDGENNKIALNSEFVLDVLNYIDSEKIVLEIEDKLAPAVFRGVDDEQKLYFHLIMPLKV